jgi:hypothetical protein
MKKDITNQSRYKSALFIQSIILNVVNLVLIAGMVGLFILIPKKADEVKTSYNDQILENEKTDAKVLSADLEKNKEEIDKLKMSVINGNNLVSFFEYRDIMKQNPAVIGFEITDNAIKTKTNASGYGVSVEAVGSIADIAKVYKEIQSIPFLIHPLTIDIERQEDGSFALSYVGILYL